MKNNKQKNKGFTLIELMVATTLFTIIMTIGMGSLVVTSNSAKAAQKLRIAVDNVNFAMESMTREIRMGTYYYCGNNYTTLSGDCSSGNNVIVFTPQSVNNVVQPRVAYKLLDGKLQRCISSDSQCSIIISPEVTIDSNGLKFYVEGSALDDKIQPSVQILMKGVVTLKGVETSFSLESMASQRSSEK